MCVCVFRFRLIIYFSLTIKFSDQPICLHMHVFSTSPAVSKQKALYIVTIQHTCKHRYHVMSLAAVNFKRQETLRQAVQQTTGFNVKLLN